MDFNEMASKLLDNLKACGGHWTRRMETSENALRTAYVEGLEQGKRIINSTCELSMFPENHIVLKIWGKFVSEINKIKKDSE